MPRDGKPFTSGDVVSSEWKRSKRRKNAELRGSSCVCTNGAISVQVILACLVTCLYMTCMPGYLFIYDLHAWLLVYIWLACLVACLYMTCMPGYLFIYDLHAWLLVYIWFHQPLLRRHRWMITNMVRVDQYWSSQNSKNFHKSQTLPVEDYIPHIETT